MITAESKEVDLKLSVAEGQMLEKHQEVAGSSNIWGNVSKESK